MKINAIANAVSFKSLRTDKKKAEQLKTGEKPILENNKQNIYKALNNIASNPERNNIQFLLDIADNLKYGQGGDSEFKSALDKDELTPANRENTNWNKLLEDTINKAISNSTEEVEDLQKIAERIFAPNKPLTEDQKELLQLRSTLTDTIVNDSTVEDSETLAITTNILKNIDYFIASSEIPVSQKKHCLEKFQYLLSDDYEINPQLEDKKLQVLDEMLNDMVVKTPESDILTTKGVNQLYTGMCAAISTCRKAVAYEDKSLYVDVVLDELNNSDTIDVYDITELGSGKKITLRKADVDYILR